MILKTAARNNLLHSPFRQVCSWSQGYLISPSAILTIWFKNLVSNAVYDFQRRFSTAKYKLSVLDHGPAVQLGIYVLETVPDKSAALRRSCFLLSYYGRVLHTQAISQLENVPNRDLL